MERRSLATLGMYALLAGVVACSSSKPATPVAPTNTGSSTGPDGVSQLIDTKTLWTTVCREAEIDNARMHDLRHTFASHLVSSGFSLPTIGRLLGHTEPRTTDRYAHLADSPIREATTRYAGIIGAALAEQDAEVISIRRK